MSDQQDKFVKSFEGFVCIILSILSVGVIVGALITAMVMGTGTP